MRNCGIPANPGDRRDRETSPEAIVEADPRRVGTTMYVGGSLLAAQQAPRQIADAVP